MNDYPIINFFFLKFFNLYTNIQDNSKNIRLEYKDLVDMIGQNRKFFVSI